MREVDHKHGFRGRTAGRVGSLVIGMLALCFTAAWPGAAAAATSEPGLAGKLVVATPAMDDPRFAEAVIFIISDDSSGTVGLIVNRPLVNMPLRELLRETGVRISGVSGSITVHYGGPVEPRVGLLLHSPDYSDPNTRLVTAEVAVTGGTGILKAIAAGKGPAKKIFGLGYVGWGPGQLTGELDRGSWFVLDGGSDFVFSKDPGSEWERALQRRTWSL